MSSPRIPVQISIQPWMRDHSFGGKAILAAVETMLLLASEAGKIHPEIDIRIFKQGRFEKFLVLPADKTTVEALIESHISPDGQVQMKLLSRIQFKGLSRIKEHGEVFFFAQPNSQSVVIDTARLKRPVTEINVTRVYQDLVPFGPTYRSLQDILYLSENKAWGRLLAPAVPLRYSVQESLGSPFPLDGAMHAACVLGQQCVDFVPFPVGFDCRSIIRPTQPGGEYITKVVLTAQTRDELTFDLGIFTQDGQVFETVSGLRMRAVGL